VRQAETYIVLKT